MAQKMSKIIAFFTLAASLFHSGCGMVALIGTPSESEKKIPAEYNFAEHTNQKILILVKQPAYLTTHVNLRYHLTKAIRKELIAKVEIPPERFIDYGELSRFRSDKSNFSLLSPVEVGKALDADMVLLVAIEDSQLGKMAESNYYKGFLNAQTILLDTANEEKLWPKSTQSKDIRVGFEIEEHGREIAVSRLVNAGAYCITRYFYDCPKPKFKIADDRSGVGWKDW